MTNTSTTSRTYYYARVSTSAQNLARQLDAFRNMGADDGSIYADKKSGKDVARPEYQRLKNDIRPGDTLVVKSLDRLSRSKHDTAAELQAFREKGVRVKVLDIPTTLIEMPGEQQWIIDMVSNILIEVLSSVAEQERITIKTRQAEGIKAMPIGADGKRHSSKTHKAVGRPALEAPANWQMIYAAWKAGELKASEAMHATGLQKTSFYKLAKMTEAKA